MVGPGPCWLGTGRGSQPREVVIGMAGDAEARRLDEADRLGVPWRRWGPYLSERQWGTVREDYSPTGDAWSSFPHDHARSRAYRWGEDGIAGISDDKQRLCFCAGAVERPRPDPQGADVRPHQLRGQPRRGRQGVLLLPGQHADPLLPEASSTSTRRRSTRTAISSRRTGPGARPTTSTSCSTPGSSTRTATSTWRSSTRRRRPRTCWSGSPSHNRGPDAATLHLLPTLCSATPGRGGSTGPKPRLHALADRPGIAAEHADLGTRWLYCDADVPLLFTENETNTERLYGSPGASPFVKDGIDRFVVGGETDAVNPERVGTKAAAHYVLDVPAGGSATVRLRLAEADLAGGRDHGRVRRADRPAESRGRRVLREPDASGDDRGGMPGRPAGARRDAVDQAVLRVRRGALVGRARPRPDGPGLGHPQCRLVPPRRR